MTSMHIIFACAVATVQLQQSAAVENTSSSFLPSKAWHSTLDYHLALCNNGIMYLEIFPLQHFVCKKFQENFLLSPEMQKGNRSKNVPTTYYLGDMQQDLIE